LKRSNRLVLLIGIFLAIVAFVLVLLTIGKDTTGGPGASVTPTTLNIVVAAKDIPLSSKFAADDLTYKEIPIPDKPADAFTDVSFVIGKVARQPVIAGQYISSAVLGSNEGVITTLECPAGLVCMAVQVDQVSGIGTLTKAGDHVDMLVGVTADKFPVVTVNPDDDSITVVSGLNGTSVKALLQGLQVVGTLLPPPPANTGTTDPNASPGTSGTTDTSLNGQQQIVILAVNTQQAEVIKYAQLDGSISLVLRATADFVDPVTGDPLPPETIIPVTTTGITLKSLVDDYGVLVPELVEAILPNQPARP
jgi:Flp pilus assembly protein CpaB